MSHRLSRSSSAVRRVLPVVILASIQSLMVVAVVIGVAAWSEGSLRNDWGSLAAIALTVTLQSLLIVWFLSSRVELWLSKSLAGLTQTAQRVLKPESTSTSPGSQSEDPNQIRMAFNALLDQINRHDLEMKAIREDMERRVEERTVHLKQARETAENATRLKSQFLASISHELRTPMHAILSFSRFGMEKMHEAGPEKLTSYFKNINDSGTRLLALLDDLLDLAKLESGKTTYSFESENLLQIVQTTIAEFQCLAFEKQCALELVEGTDVVVQMDRKRMMQVVRNILSNAIKFSPEGGTVHLRVRKVDGAATVEIRDEGLGIPEEDLDGIFEKFVQARNISSDVGGTGLGLAICREIVNAHNGDIWVYNDRSCGAVFVFTVPIYTPDAGSGSFQPIDVDSPAEDQLTPESVSTGKNSLPIATAKRPS